MKENGHRLCEGTAVMACTHVKLNSVTGFSYMPRFYIDKDEINKGIVTISGNEARHIGKVLRLKEDDDVTLFDDNGVIYNGKIIKKDHKQVQVRIDRESSAHEQKNVIILLGQALTKGSKMDLIVQKSTELGVSRIIPFSSSRTVMRYDEKQSHARVSHWQRIALASAKQSGRRHIPAVENIASFNNLITRDFPGYLKIILWEEESAVRLRHILKNNAELHAVIFLVGPEGGFDPNEVACAREQGFIPVSLGETVLRTETVSSAVLSVVRYESGDFG
jgi:16S rRNA (uracil1498-N3)-methyltransferase